MLLFFYCKLYSRSLVDAFCFYTGAKREELYKPRTLRVHFNSFLSDLKLNLHNAFNFNFFLKCNRFTLKLIEKIFVDKYNVTTGEKDCANWYSVIALQPEHHMSLWFIFFFLVCWESWAFSFFNFTAVQLLKLHLFVKYAVYMTKRSWFGDHLCLTFSVAFAIMLFQTTRAPEIFHFKKKIVFKNLETCIYWYPPTNQKYTT